MTFVSNHDQNAWQGTHNGQEAGDPKRLEFFEKDPIASRDHPVGDLYRTLFELKHRNSALWNAPWGALMVRVPSDDETRVLSFAREPAESVTGHEVRDLMALAAR